MTIFLIAFSGSVQLSTLKLSHLSSKQSLFKSPDGYQVAFDNSIHAFLLAFRPSVKEKKAFDSFSASPKVNSCLYNSRGNELVMSVVARGG